MPDDNHAPLPETQAQTDELSSDDVAMFLAAMSGATPLLHRDEHVNKAPSARRPQGELPITQGKSGWRFAAHGELGDLSACGSDVQCGIAPGVNFQLLAALRRGDFAPRRRLDLHGLRQDAAQGALVHFVRSAAGENERCVLVVTGRGHKSPSGVSVLREAFPVWISQPPLQNLVLAFCTALPRDGGTGAFYVLLRQIK